MSRLVALAAVAALAGALAPLAPAGVHVVPAFDPGDYAARGAIGLAVPGAGPTVTRGSALATLVTGKVVSSLLGGVHGGTPLIELGDPEPPFILVALPPPGRTENARYPIVVVGDGARGVLTSDSTRIAGLVSLSDVARGRLRSVHVDDPAGTLERLDRRIGWNDRYRLPLTVLLGAIAYVVALVTPRLAPRVILLGLAANLWLAGWWAVALVGLAATLLPLGGACAAVVAAYLLALGLDPEAVALSPLGPSQAGRFYGVSNLLETALLVPALVGAARLGRLGLGLAGLALVAVGGNRFGADGGGLLVLLASYGMLALRSSGTRLTPARGTVLAGGVLLGGLLLVGIDAKLGGSSHVTDAVSGGPGTLVHDIGDRLELSARRTFEAFGPAFAVVASLPVVAWVASRSPRGPATDAMLAALAVSIVVNDTPGDVVGLGAAALFAVYRWETASPDSRTSDLVRLRPMRRSSAAAAAGLLAALGLLAAGCGGEDVSATPETVVGSVPTQTEGGNDADLPALSLKGDAAKGKTVFASAGCGGCHTLAAAGSGGNIGPNLDDAKPTYELVVTRVTKGQGGMPSFSGQLDAQQIADVAQYVSESTAG